MSSGKILVIGTDSIIFDPHSSAGMRIREYAALFDEYHMIIYTPRGFKQESAQSLSLYPTNSFFFFMRPFGAFRMGRRIIRDRGIKLVSVQDPAETGIVGWLLKKMLDVKLHIQIHADFLSPFFREGSWKDQLRYRLAKFIIPQGDAFRVVSKRIANSLNSELLVLSSKISILPIFVDRAKIAVAKPSFDLRQKYPQFDFIVLMVSRLAREKNIEMALEAFSGLIKEFPKSGLVIVGDGPEGKNLELGARSLELGDKVRFEGWQEDLIPYYKSADLYLLTSNFEGYGRTVVEAAAAGCLVIMTDVGVAGEVIRDKETGRVVRIKDTAQLLDILLWIRQNRVKALQMGEKAQTEALSLVPKSWEEYLLMYAGTIKVCFGDGAKSK